MSQFLDQNKGLELPNTSLLNGEIAIWNSHSLLSLLQWGNPSADSFNVYPVKCTLYTQQTLFI